MKETSPEVGGLTARIVRLEAENEQLRDALAPVFVMLPRCLNLTKIESAILCCLLETAPMPARTRRIYYAIYGSVDHQPQSKTLGVFIYELRGKLRGTGATIDTWFGVGYGLSAESAAILQAMVAAP